MTRFLVGAALSLALLAGAAPEALAQATPTIPDGFSNAQNVYRQTGNVVLDVPDGMGGWCLAGVTACPGIPVYIIDHNTGQSPSWATGTFGAPAGGVTSVQGGPGAIPVNTNDSAATSNNAAFQGEVALTVGTADTSARRSLKAVCTAAGNVSVTYADASTGVWPAVVGAQTWPIAITTVNTSGTTASCTYANLK